MPTKAANRRLDIAAHIRSQIFDGGLRPGTKIDQDAVASATRSSRIPVREALIVLEREGLVAWSHFRGAYVADLTEADIRDHFALLGATAALVSQQVEQSNKDARRVVGRAVQRLVESRSHATSQRRLAELRDAFIAAGISHRLALEFERLTVSLPLWRFEQVRSQPRKASREALEAGSAAVNYYHDLGELVIRRLQEAGFWDERARPITVDGQPR